MWSSAGFKQATGVAMTDTVAKMEQALIKKYQAQTGAEIAVALLVAELTDRQWKVSEAALSVGISQQLASKAGARGRILMLAGEAQVEIIWQAIVALGSGDALTKLREEVAAIDWQEPEEGQVSARATYILHKMRTTLTAQRLGDNATAERTAAIVERLTANGCKTPAAVRAAIPSTADALSIPLPTYKRPGSSRGATDGQNVPTVKKATEALAAVIDDRHQADAPEEYSPQEVDDAWRTIGAALRIILTGADVDKFAVIDRLAEMVDEFETLCQTLAADRAAHAQMLAEKAEAERAQDAERAAGAPA